MRGLSVLLLVLALSGGLALLADAAFDLPWMARAALLGVWLVLAAVLSVIGLIVPLTRRLDLETIAAVVEEKYPDLGERLTTTVELSGDTAAYHGSPAFIALLVSETETRTSRLDFLSAVPSRFVWVLGAVAVGVLLLLASPAVVAPERYGELTQRFFLPLANRPAVNPPFAIDVTTGDATAAVGRPFTLAAHTRLLRSDATLPAGSTLVVDDGQGSIRRERMTADAADAFSFQFDKLPGSFAYRVEADGIQSETHHVRGIVPVELAADQPVITITPPEYARGNEATQVVNGLNDLKALQYSQVAFEFRFTRSAVAATLHWVPKRGDSKNAAEPQVIKLELSDDGLSARAALAAVTDARYRISMEAEDGIRTEPDDRALAVQVDKPPKFVKVAMPDDGKTVLPYEKVPIDADLADDFGVAKAEVEYRVNNGPSKTDDITLWGDGGREAQAQHLFTLGGKVKDGDAVAYRLKLYDNRSIPEVNLTPNITYYPAEGWRNLRISRQAIPLREQEIQAARDSIDKKIEAIKEEVRKEKRGVYRLQQETRKQDALGTEQAQDLKGLQKDNLSIEDALRDVSQEAADAGLKPIADRARDVAEKEMHNSAEELRAVPKQKTADNRSQRFDKTDQELANALQKLEDLKKANEQLAQQRLDQMKLETAAERQKDLAERAKELAAKDPVKDPSAKAEAEKLKQEQQEAANELQRLTEQSDALKNALDQARAEEAKEIAQKAKELAEEQRLLAEAEKNTEQKQGNEKFAELAKKQQELAEQAAKLAKETKPATQAAKTNPLKPDEAEKAAEALKQNNIADALRNQDQSAKELDRLANDLDRAIDLAKDPREAARQLARLEEDLQKRLADEAKKPGEKALAPLQREQEAIRQATDRLSLPPQNQGAKEDRKQAAEHAQQAAEALKKADSNTARAQMEQTKQALNRLADKLPTLAQRQQQAAREVAELRRQQDDIARQAEQAAREAEKKDPNAPKTREELAKKLTDAARKQAEAAERIGKMDAPNQEARQERVQESLNRALADLMDARPQDIAASQQEAKRELERLQQALNGQKPADEQAQELAKRQRDLADEAKQAAADAKTTPQKQQELKQKQQQIANETANLHAPEAPQRKAEAADAAKKAAEQATQKPTDANTQKRMDAAAKTLERLAQQMSGKEAETARAERLAKKQAEAAAQAERQAKANPNQPPTAEAQQNQQRIGDEAKQVRGGQEAQAEKKKANEALAKAQQAWKAEDKAKATREAADALRDLADKLAHKDAADKAAEIAKEQRDLANQAKPEAAKEQAPDAARKAADQQADIARQTERLDAKGASEARKEAAKEMAAAKQALDNAQTPADAKAQLDRAADAADKLAREVAKEQAAQANADKTNADKAKQLAHEQRDLAKQTQQAQANAAKKPGEAGKQQLQKAMEQIAQAQLEAERPGGQAAHRGGQEAGRASA